MVNGTGKGNWIISVSDEVVNSRKATVRCRPCKESRKFAKNTEIDGTKGEMQGRQAQWLIRMKGRKGTGTAHVQSKLKNMNCNRLL